MSSPDRSVAAWLRRLLLAGATLSISAAAGCTVQPLYGDVTSATPASGGTVAELRTVAVNPVGDRVSQEVRNHLIFLLGGGAGQPSSPRYSLDLGVAVLRTNVAAVQPSAEDLEPTAAVMTLRGTYVLTETATGTRISAGVRAVQAAFDVPSQNFAALRAERDAQNRAARELAELLRLVIAQELQNATSSRVPAIISAPQEIEGIADEESPGTVVVQ